MELVQAVRHVCVVLEVARALGLAGAEGAAQPTSLRERAEDERGEPRRRLDEVLAVEPAPGFGQRREREPVPRCDRLVVAGGLRAQLARLEQLSPLLLT